MTMWPDRLRARHFSTRIHRPLAWMVGLATRWHARLQSLREHGLAHWHRLTPGERLQLKLLVTVLAAALIWLLGTRPALHSLRYWNEELPRLRSQSAALQEVLAEVGSPQAAQAPPLSTAIHRIALSLDQAGLAGSYRLQQSGTELCLFFTPTVDAYRLGAWLLHAPATLGLTVQHATLERGANSESASLPPQIHAALTLTPTTRDGI